jgi:5-methylcytosine-specific restriction endonuclease McrA
MFCEEDNLQLLCKACHDTKSAEEAAERKKYR